MIASGYNDAFHKMYECLHDIKHIWKTDRSKRFSHTSSHFMCGGRIHFPTETGLQKEKCTTQKIYRERKFTLSINDPYATCNLYAGFRQLIRVHKITQQTCIE